MKIKPSLMNIGTKLYQYSPQILAYEIIGIQVMKTFEHEQTFYILRCLSCSDHKNCELAVKFNDYECLEYSHMVNNYDIDEEYREEHGHYRNKQYYWHRNKDYYWFLTKTDARVFAYEKSIKYCESIIEDSKKIIERNEKEIAEYKEKIQSMKDAEHEFAIT